MIHSLLLNFNKKKLFFNKLKKISMAKKITNEEYIQKLKSIHGDSYDYSKVKYINKNTKVCITCPIHGDFFIYPMNMLKGVGCVQCFNENKRIETIKKNIEKCKQIYNNYYDYSLVNFTEKDKIDIICPKHGIFTQNLKDHINGHKCPKCSYEELSENKKRKYSYEELVNDGTKIHNGKYSYPQQEIKYFYDDCIITCPIHGDFKQKINNHINDSYGCPKCALDSLHKSKKYSINDIKLLLNDKTNISYNINSYVNMNTPMEFTCNTCNNTFKRPLTVFLNENDTCPYCNKLNSNKRFKTTEEFIDEANKVHNNYYDYSVTKYIRSNDYVDVICPEHGLFKIEANSHLQGHGCPLHYKNTSKLEKEVSDYIISLIGEKNVILNSKNILDSKKEIDIFVPSYNLAIEFNGLYWHNELNKDKDYHLNKTIECNKNGIRLFHIFEDEWIYKQDIIKSMLKNFLHLIDIRIYARKCEIKEVNPKDSKEFLNNNHLQGNCNGSVKLGLYYNNELISLMVFGASRHFVGSGKEQYELLRFCNKLHTNIIGGASKLFNHFITKYNPSSIISFADRRWSNGNVYNILGFSLYNESKPNYYYIINDKRIYRYNLRKDILVKKYNCPKEKSEKQFCLEQKWYRIYDCGCLCYRWDNVKNV